MVIAFTPGLQPQQIGTVADVVVSGLALAIQAALGILGVLTQQVMLPPKSGVLGRVENTNKES